MAHGENVPNLTAIVMAAGHGTRMKSEVPKVVHPASGRPLCFYPVRAALELGAAQVIVVVNPSTREAVEAALSAHLGPAGLDAAKVSFAVQEVPRGTGDAVRSAMSQVKPDRTVVILSGDAPLLEADDLRPLVATLSQEVGLAFMSFELADPTGYGRVVRSADGRVSEIVEQKDLKTEAERAISEVNSGVYALSAELLVPALAQLSPKNAQGEYYLTDIVALSAASTRVETVIAKEESLAGVNDQAQLSWVEKVLHERIRTKLGQRGVRIFGAPLIDDSVAIEPGARIEDGVRLRGATTIGAGTTVDVGCVVEDSTIGAEVNLKPYSVVVQSSVARGAQIGPFAHLRPESVIEEDAHLGNFVETKKTIVRKGAKANHLTYLGDADIGEKSNIGAGTIVCNYDGFLKQRTVVGRGVFIGSDSQLIAPVTIGDGAYIATNTTVSRDVPAGALAIGRSRQSNKEGYAEPLRAKLKAAAELAKKPRS